MAVTRVRPHTRRIGLVRVKGHDRVVDKMYRAKPAGRRRSKSGNVYYEYRENRADANPKKRL